MGDFFLTRNVYSIPGHSQTSSFFFLYSMLLMDGVLALEIWLKLVVIQENLNMITD